jgi:UDP-N-acetylglucosamine--N-acetylmuramyl-(pentapeptide) pyrophosphoryl-undecaprenol N-acetylglucosamine transferase
LVVTGGGTGGHIYPAIAIAKRIQRAQGALILFIGSDSGPEGDAARAANIDFEGLRISGIVGKRPLAMIRSIYSFVFATIHCRRLFAEERPDCVIGTGGYAAAPACFAAACLEIPLILHEMNFQPGLVTRLLSGRAKAVAVSYEGTIGLLRKGTRAHVTGVPVREDIESLSVQAARERSRDEALQTFGLEHGRRTLIIFGGSQGAQALNAATWDALPALSDRSDIQVLHLTGWSGYEDPRRESTEVLLEDAALVYRALAYREDIHLAYSIADLALARAGAGTIAELTAAAVPSVLVPFPYSASGHQENNARELAAKGGARVVPEQGGSASQAVSEALRLVCDTNKLDRMREALLGLQRVPGAEGIAALVEELR